MGDLWYFAQRGRGFDRGATLLTLEAAEEAYNPDSVDGYPGTRLEQ